MFRPFLFSLLTAATLTPATVSAQGPPVLLADTNPRPAARIRDVIGITPVNGTIVFVANDGELWTTDGTDAGTVAVDTTYPRYIWEMVKSGSSAFFVAESEFGRELWKTDGTAAGTRVVKDIAPGQGSSQVENPTDVGGTLFFTVGTEGQRGLWKTDGTEAGTVLVKAGEFSQLTALGGTLICTGKDAVHGEELWTSDGTAAGTHLVKDIRPGAFTSQPGGMLRAGDAVYFAAFGTAQGLWRTDGTEAGTVLIEGGGSPFAAMGNTFYFTVAGQLWRTDGSPGGTTLVRTFPVKTTLYGEPVFLSPCAIGGTLFFSIVNPDGTTTLWKTDGTDAGAVKVKDIWVGQPVALGDTLVFSAGLRLYKSDGTPEGTVEVQPADPAIPAGQATGSFPGLLQVINGTVYYSANGDHDPSEPNQNYNTLWKSDGTAAGTVRVAVEDTTLGAGLWMPPVMSRGAGYFVSGVAGRGRLWRTEGTPETTRQILPEAGLDVSYEVAECGGWLYFVSSDGVSDSLWKTDGTDAGTTMVKSGAEASIEYLHAVGGRLYFHLYDPANGTWLWSTDGSPSGTQQVKRLSDFPHLPMFSILAGLGDQAYFIHSPDNASRSLWKTDGTEAGTVLVKQLPDSTSPRGTPRTVGGVIYFNLVFGGGWRTDGTAEGTFLVANGPGALDGFITVAGNALYFFTVDSGAHRARLMKSDGTPGGATEVASFDSDKWVPSEATAFGNSILFPVDTPETGNELWISDGTRAGTRLVKDLRPGPPSSDPAWIVVHRGRAFFRADGGSGNVLWSSDGLDWSTYPITSRSGDQLGFVGERLFFTSWDVVTGNEPYAYDPTSSPIDLFLTGVVATPGAATARGTVNAGGLPTTVTFHYSVASPFVEPSFVSMPVPLAENNLLVGVDVSAALTGLTPGGSYYGYFKAVNALGEATSHHELFTVPVATPLTYWLAEHDASGGAGGDKDKDGVKNVLEYAFGTDPADPQIAPLVESGGVLARRGLPIVRGKGAQFRGLFVRRKDRAASGLVYTPQFSADLVEWLDATTTPQIIGGGEDYQLLSYPAPVIPGGPQLRFFRVKVEAP